MLRRQTMAACNRAYLHARLEGFCLDLRLDLIRPVASARRTLQDFQPAYVAPSRSQQMLHRLFRSFAPIENAKLAETAPMGNMSKRWCARTGYAF